MIKTIKTIHQNALDLVGLSIQASLNQDISDNLVTQLREKFLASNGLNKHATLYLIQKYPDEEWSPDLVFTHIVATEKSNFNLPLENSITEIIPAGKFVSFEYEGPEAEIDLAYEFIRDWLIEHKLEDNRPYDLENWGTKENLVNPQPVIELLIPLP